MLSKSYIEFSKPTNATPAVVKRLFYCQNLTFKINARAKWAVLVTAATQSFDWFRTSWRVFVFGGTIMAKEHATIQSIPPAESDPTIIRIQNPDGTHSYFHESKDPVKVYSMDIRDFLDLLFEHFQTLIKILTKANYEDFGWLLHALLLCSKRQLHEMTHFLSEEIRIQIDVIPHSDKFDREDRVVGVSVTPVKHKEKNKKPPVYAGG